MDKDLFSQRIRIPITGLKSTFSRSMAKLKIIMHKRHGGMANINLSSNFHYDQRLQVVELRQSRKIKVLYAGMVRVFLGDVIAKGHSNLTACTR